MSGRQKKIWSDKKESLKLRNCAYKDKEFIL